MPRIPWILVSTVVLTMSGCVSGERSPSEHSRAPSSALETRIDAAIQVWKQCVTRSFPAQARLGTDRNLAVEQAFSACRREEAATIPRGIEKEPSVLQDMG